MRPAIPLRYARFAIDDWQHVPTPETGEMARMMPGLAKANAAREQWHKERNAWAQENGYSADELRAAESIAGVLDHPSYQGRDKLPALRIEWA